MRIRPAMFAGSWYPSSAVACRREIQSFLESNPTETVSERPFTGGIVPHAGWAFSGAIACNVIRLLSRGDAPDLVWLFGMHLHPRSSAVITKEGGWQTPLGALPIDTQCAGEMAGRFSFTVETADDFTPDNTIELQLPFVKHFFPDARIVPVGVPPNAEAPAMGRAAVEISNRLGRRIRIVGSTDLTHYGPNYGFSPKGTGSAAVSWVKEENDRRIIDAILSLSPDQVIEEALSHQNACCAGAAAAAIAAGTALGADAAELVAYATSYDKHPGDSLVGYAGVVF